MKFGLLNRFILLNVFVHLSVLVSGQLSSRDSLIILNLGATNITDSIYSPLPKPIRNLLVEYLRLNKFEPTEYFTIGDFHPTANDSVAYLSIVRIGALRDLSSEFVFPGAAGGEGDDLFVIFDKDYKSVKYITNSE
jgi:hypothetical protein